MTQYPDLFAALAAPFDPNQVKARTQSGRQLHYITARTAMNRLDSVLGPERWFDEYVPADKSVVCKLSIQLADGTWLTKADAGGYAGMSDEGDDEKSGYSDAFKRACVKFGVGRYLYQDGVPDFARDSTPAPAPARQAPSPARQPAGPSTPSRQTNFDNFKIPPPGKAVFAWAKFLEDHFQTTLVKGMGNSGESRGWGSNLKDWNQDQVNTIAGEVIEYLKGESNYKGEFGGEAGVTSVASPQTQGDRKLRKRVILDTTKLWFAKTYGNVPDGDELREAVGLLAASVPNAAGQTGEALGSLVVCQDDVLLGNMETEIKRMLSTARPAEPAPQAAQATNAADDDDIPF